MENLTKTCLSSVTPLYRDILMPLTSKSPLVIFISSIAFPRQSQPHDLVFNFSSNQHTFFFPHLCLLRHFVFSFTNIWSHFYRLDLFPVISGSLFQVFSPRSVFKCSHVCIYLTNSALKAKTKDYSIFEHPTLHSQVLSL